MSLAVHAKGTTLARGDGATPEVFTAIAECKSITGPSFEGATIDVTTHSTVGKYREFKANILDPGSLDFDINWVGTNVQHKALLTDQANQTERNYKLTTMDLPAGTIFFILRCQVIRYNFSFPVDNVQTASLSLKIIGPPTLPV